MLVSMFPGKIKCSPVTIYMDCGSEYEVNRYHEYIETFDDGSIRYIWDEISDFDTLEGAFWLAEKVGLFENMYVIGKNWSGEYFITDQTHNDWLNTQQFVGKTVPEVICKAVLEIYGKKHDNVV